MLIRSLIRAGADGLVAGDHDGMSGLVEAIRAVADGETFISQGAAATLANEDEPDLTERELAVCRLIALGYSTREAAEELGVSTRTVDGYRARLNEKLGFESRRDLVQFALKYRLIP